jgi:hypothetical protein
LAYRLERPSEPNGSRAKEFLRAEKKRGLLLFAFAEKFCSVYFGYVFETCFYELCGFFDVAGA